MWKYSFFNLSFVVLLITLLALQHSIAVFGPRALGNSDSSQGSEDYPSAASFAPRELARAAAFIQDTWRRAMIFREWSMEYAAAQWEISNASSPAESDLLEARFHVANAEVLSEAMSANDRALVELDRAETSLADVQTSVASTLGPRLKIIEDEITAAEITERAGPIFTAAPLEAIKTNLDRLIGSVHGSMT
jgi:hypothetical protein